MKNNLLLLLKPLLTQMVQQTKFYRVTFVSAAYTASLFLLCFTATAQMPKVGSINDMYNTLSDSILIKQQNSVFMPELTPFGFVQPRNNAQIMVDEMKQRKGNGTTADDILKQQQLTATHGKLPPTQEEIKAQQQAWLNGKPPEQNRQQKITDNVVNLLNEASKEERNKRYNTDYYKSPEFAAKTKSFADALQTLKDMQSGKRKLSVSDAYYTIENAYGNTYLNKEEFDKNLNESADFIKKWLTQNGYDLKDNAALHLGIQKFMSDTLTISSTSPDNVSKSYKKIHYPFFYDYDDFKGEKDYRNYFMTKCLATGSGQCNSLPSVYNSLADKLGAKSYLSLAPYHSFVKYPDNKGNMHGYEPTSNWKISDKWYEDNMFVSPEAKRNRIYLDTLNKKQIVANCMLDLAVGYLDTIGVADGNFVRECVSAGLPYFPNQNNVEALLIYSSVLSRQLDRVLQQHGAKSLSEINKIPEAAALYKALEQNEEAILQLGYSEQPEQLYEQVMQEHEFKGKRQKAQKINSKQYRQMFLTLTK